MGRVVRLSRCATVCALSAVAVQVCGAVPLDTLIITQAERLKKIRLPMVD